MKRIKKVLLFYGIIMFEVRPFMELMFIVAGDDYARHIANLLNEHNFPVTEVGSSGDFLQYGETVFLLGIEDGKSDEVIRILDPEATNQNGEKTPFKNEVSIYISNIDKYVKVNA